MANYVEDQVPDDQEDVRQKAVDEYADLMRRAKIVLSILQEHRMACVRCSEEHTCKFAYDLYNFDQEPGVDCLAAK